MSNIESKTIYVDGGHLKVRIRRGEGVPLLIFNGIGTNLECLEPLTSALDGIETIEFGSPLQLAKMFAPRRHTDPAYFHEIAPELYGGEVCRNPEVMNAYRSRLQPPHWLGYLYQQLAICGWTSLFWLPLLRQRTLVLAGSDDPLAPVINSSILASLIPQAKLHIVDDGHLFLMTGAHAVAPLIRTFLLAR